MEADATPEHPRLAIHMHLDFQLAAELMAQIDRRRQPARAEAAQSMMSNPMDTVLLCVSVVLPRSNDLAAGRCCSQPALRRELYFRVLTGAQGNAM